MIFDFHSLHDKLRQLVELSHALRSENAELRSENARLNQRMQEAHERIARLLASLPAEAAVDVSKAIDREAA